MTEHSLVLIFVCCCRISIRDTRKQFPLFCRMASWYTRRVFPLFAMWHHGMPEGYFPFAAWHVGTPGGCFLFLPCGILVCPEGISSSLQKRTDHMVCSFYVSSFIFACFMIILQKLRPLPLQQELHFPGLSYSG